MVERRLMVDVVQYCYILLVLMLWYVVVIELFCFFFVEEEFFWFFNGEKSELFVKSSRIGYVSLVDSHLYYK